MLEQLLFEPLAMPGEQIRIFLALAGTIATVYFDIFNKRNVPNTLLYAFLGVAILTNILFYDPVIFTYAVGLAAIVFLLGFFLYKMGQIGGADLFVICSIILLLPIHPSNLETLFNYPLIFSTLLYGGVAFSIFSIFYFGGKVLKSKDAKPNLLYLLLILPYAAFTYLFITAPFFSPVYFAIASIFLLSSIFFLVYRDAIMASTMGKVPLSKITDEDVLAKEKMQPLMQELKIGPVIGEKELAILKKAKVKEVWIYAHLPPFLPFLLIGLIASILYGNWILLVFY
jgi:Flp pilus assembly protein protease CpaA